MQKYHKVLSHVFESFMYKTRYSGHFNFDVFREYDHTHTHTHTHTHVHTYTHMLCGSFHGAQCSSSMIMFYTSRTYNRKPINSHFLNMYIWICIWININKGKDNSKQRQTNLTILFCLDCPDFLVNILYRCKRTYVCLLERSSPCKRIPENHHAALPSVSCTDPPLILTHTGACDSIALQEKWIKIVSSWTVIVT